MKRSRVDYSELVTALRQNREGLANNLIEELIPRLEDYLRVTMNASPADAEECIQQAFANVYEQILQDNIKNEKYIFSYLIRACRNEYIRYSKQQHRFNSPIDAGDDHMTVPAEQIENMVDEDRQRVLRECLQELQQKSREFIEYFIDKPDTSTKEASKFFKLSGANVRTKKSRILSKLHHCFKRKWSD